MADTFPSLFWSYTIVWAVLAVYICALGYRLSKLDRTLRRMEGKDDGKITATD